MELKEKLETTLQKIETLSKDLETLKDFEQERTGHQENQRVKLEKEKQMETFEQPGTVGLGYDRRWRRTEHRWKPSHACHSPKHRYQYRDVQ